MKTNFSDIYSKFSNLEQEALLQISPLQAFSTPETLEIYFQLSNFPLPKISNFIDKLFTFGLIYWHAADLDIGLKQYFRFNPNFSLFLRSKTRELTLPSRCKIFENYILVGQNKVHSLGEFCQPQIKDTREKESIKDLIHYEYLDIVNAYLLELKRGKLDTKYLELLGWFQLDTNEYDYFNYLVDKALEAISSDNEQQRESFVWLFFILATNESKVGNETSALRYISSALKISSETKINKELYLKTINLKAITLRQLFQKTQDEKYFNDLVGCMEELNDFVPEERNIESYNELYLSSKAELAFCYCAKDKIDKGLNIYYDILSKTKNEAFRIVINNNLGNIFSLNDYPRAKACFLQSFVFYKRKKQFHEIGRTLLRLANLELRFKKISIQEIEIIVKQAMEIFIKLNDERRISLAKKLLISLDNQKTK